MIGKKVLMCFVCFGLILSSNACSSQDKIERAEKSCVLKANKLYNNIYDFYYNILCVYFSKGITNRIMGEFKNIVSFSIDSKENCKVKVSIKNTDTGAELVSEVFKDEDLHEKLTKEDITKIVALEHEALINLGLESIFNGEE